MGFLDLPVYLCSPFFISQRHSSWCTIMKTNKMVLMLLLTHIRKISSWKRPITTLHCFTYSDLTMNTYQLHSIKKKKYMSSSSKKMTYWRILYIHQPVFKSSDFLVTKSDDTEFITTVISVQVLNQRESDVLNMLKITTVSNSAFSPTFSSSTRRKTARGFILVCFRVPCRAIHL